MRSSASSDVPHTMSRHRTTSGKSVHLVRNGCLQDVGMAQDQKIVYGKLVRDRVPEIISAGGAIPEVRVLGAVDFFPALIAKLHEEAEESQKRRS